MCTILKYNIQTEKMECLCSNQINTYNYGMGDVDIADQLCVFYRLDHWMRNKKWWWSITIIHVLESRCYTY